MPVNTNPNSERVRKSWNASNSAPKGRQPHVHGSASPETDTVLTDPALIAALAGPNKLFDLDPCCPVKMPWNTAKMQLHYPKQDGLELPWHELVGENGRVWLNPPYSDVGPWARRIAFHGRGSVLVSAKSADAQWFQLLLSTCDAFCLPAGRQQFYDVNGKPRDGKWLSSAIFAFGAEDCMNLLELCRDRNWAYIVPHNRAKARCGNKLPRGDHFANQARHQEILSGLRLAYQLKLDNDERKAALAADTKSASNAAQTSIAQTEKEAKMAKFKPTEEAQAWAQKQVDAALKAAKKAAIAAVKGVELSPELMAPKVAKSARKSFIDAVEASFNGSDDEGSQA